MDPSAIEHVSWKTLVPQLLLLVPMGMLCYLLSSTTPVYRPATIAQIRPAADERVLLQQAVIVPAGEHKMLTCITREGLCLTFSIEGIRNSEKGFAVQLLDAQDYLQFMAKKPYQVFTAINLDKTTGTAATLTLPAGSYHIVITNQHNLIEAIEVQVVVVAKTSKAAK